MVGDVARKAPPIWEVYPVKNFSVTSPREICDRNFAGPEKADC